MSFDWEGFAKELASVLWMARRYAHGRKSYAVGMYNDVARKAWNIGLISDDKEEPIFALDGDLNPAMSNLSADEQADIINRLVFSKFASERIHIKNLLDAHAAQKPTTDTHNAD